MHATCAGCGSDFEARSSRARWCSDRCRKSAPKRARPKSDASRRAGRDLLASTRAELRRLGKTNTLKGRQAILLSTRMSEPGESGSSVSAMSRELDRLMAEISAAERPADPVDEAQGRARGILRILEGGRGA